MGIESVHQIQELFAPHGVTQVYVKHLAPKQDNDKNQIYLGKGIDGIANILPSRDVVERAPSQSTKKAHSDQGSPITEASLNLSWLSRDGALHRAPEARIINYFQYPEVRISGFLKGCDDPPDALRRTSLDKYGKRILLLGVARGVHTIGLVLTETEDPIVGDFPDLPPLPVQPLLRVMAFGDDVGRSPTEMLLEELTAIHLSGWCPSATLKPGCEDPEPFRGNQGGGYTLEALLGVPRNSDAKPDKYGYEIKSFSPGKKISLMTPTADAGFEGDNTFRDFMAKYGNYRDDDSYALSGVYRCNQPNKKTGFVMRIEGYDPETQTFDEDVSKIRIVIRDEVNDVDVSAWTFSKIANKWSEKHASACYVPRERRSHEGSAEHDYDYRYLDYVYICEGTSVKRLFAAIHSGMVYYDPAHRIYANGKPSVRPQWRISTPRIEETLGYLYREVRSVPLEGEVAANPVKERIRLVQLALPIGEDSPA